MKKGATRIGNILFWSIISAAFIGPGTVTTASKAGAYHHYDLMWSVVFSIIGCLTLQEAVARIAIYSGKSLAENVSDYYFDKKSKYFVLSTVISAILIGGAAYETGNILGAVEGLKFIFPKVEVFVLILAIAVFVVLAFRMKSMRLVAQVLGVFVYLMGFAFIITAISVRPEFIKVLRGTFIPTIPDYPGIGLLILGIIGTTIVPYDLFLGSGIIDKRQTIFDARLGLSVSIILGGLITLAIMAVGSSLTEGMTEKNLAELDFNFSFIKQGLYLNSYINDYALWIFGFGIFAAGLTSAITAPLASVLTAKGITYRNSDEKKWTNRGFFFNVISLGTLAIGVFFGLLQIKPIPAIILAQALNGFILPFVTYFVIQIINDKNVMNGKINSNFGNLMLYFVFWVTLSIGILNIFKAIQSTFSIVIDNQKIFPYIAALNLVITIFVAIKIYKKRQEQKNL